MTRDLGAASVPDLLARYESAAKLAGQIEDTRRQNLAANELSAIHLELRRRGNTALLALVPFLASSDGSLRLWAASHLLPDPQAETVLEEIAAGRGLDSVTAKYTLGEWRAGRLTDGAPSQPL